MDDYNTQSGQSSYGESTGAGTGAAGTAARMKEQAPWDYVGFGVRGRDSALSFVAPP